MKLSRVLTWTLLLAVGLAATLAYGQRFRPRIVQNAPPATEFIAARWHFGTNGYIGHMGWSHNYPQSDRHLNDYLTRTRIDVQEASYLIVELGSEEIFDYPFAYVSEPGEMELTAQEVENLREYVDRGGFILVDDFDGPTQWAQFHSQVKRAFPGREFVPLDIAHGVFNTPLVLENLQAMSAHVPGGEITYYGLFDEEGHLGILAGHNSDLANFWDWYANGSMPLKPSTDAFRLGTNAVVWSMTH